MTCTLDPVWLDVSAADDLLAHALAEVPWRSDDITLFGRTHPIPRLHCWFADAGMTYRWSGITLHPAPWTPTILAVRARLEAELGRPFPFLLANLYRNGADSMGWHTDDEREMGGTPTIASVSVGAARDFLVREKATGHRASWHL
ncbi:MAG: alpha-ketoglutarate-dependent dioxygenase AlkB, partial [Myxococcales bacterium]|nr:alpha-ketoglutarate-dependent dioxygenase AlkB [Myxococcales bacterium]